MTYGFLLHHHSDILKGFVNAYSKESAITKLEEGDWDDVIDEYDTDDYIEGYEVIEIYE